jgi:aspartyl aminopeptidase
VGPEFYSRSFIVAAENFAPQPGAKPPITLGSGCRYDWGIRTQYSVDSLALQRFLKKMADGGVQLGPIFVGDTVISQGSSMMLMLSITGIDVGLPVSGLNSSRELVAIKDVEELAKLVQTYFARGRSGDEPPARDPSE